MCRAASVRETAAAGNCTQLLFHILSDISIKEYRSMEREHKGSSGGYMKTCRDYVEQQGVSGNYSGFFI